MMPHGATAASKSPHIGLFVTCLVDLFRPSVGFATMKLLEDAGCTVAVPRTQTCCGQPAWNSGDQAKAQAIARQIIQTFEKFDYVVAPSGSCAATVKKDYPEMFRHDELWKARAESLSERVFEIVSFLTDVLGVSTVDAKVDSKITYHDSCSGLRSLEIKDQPRQLLNSVAGLELVEMADSSVCCGFGGTFCVKFPDVSNKMVENKAANIAETGAAMVVAGDLGCLMNISGKLQRQGIGIQSRHVVEVLAGMVDEPAIGEPK
jgi:L-lactate dehydrogenase complex protein LldE